MEEQEKNTNAQGSAPSGNNPGAGKPEGSPAGQEIVDELSILADKFVSTVRLAWNSDQRKQIQNDLKSGLDQIAQSLEQGFDQVATSNEAKDLHTKAQEVGDKVTSSKVFADITGALTSGLRSLSDSLDKLSKDMQAKNAAGGQTGNATNPPPPPGGEPDSKDIPIDKG